MKVIPFILGVVLLLCACQQNTQSGQGTESSDSTTTEIEQFEEEMDSAEFIKRWAIRDFFGVPLNGNSIDDIVLNMSQSTSVLTIDDEIQEDKVHYVVTFCGIPCGMNISWTRWQGTVYVTSLFFMTSHSDEKSKKVIIQSITKTCGEEVEIETEDNDPQYYRYKWKNTGIVMRRVHWSDDLIVAF